MLTVTDLGGIYRCPERTPGHHRNWLDCIRSRKRPLADVEIGARSVAITILGNLAYWNSRRLRWDPAKWEFVDDPVIGDN